MTSQSQSRRAVEKIALHASLESMGAEMRRGIGPTLTASAGFVIFSVLLIGFCFVLCCSSVLVPHFVISSPAGGWSVVHPTALGVEALLLCMF